MSEPAAPGGPGGRRPGAGRPRRSVKFARPIAAAEKRLADKLPMLIDRLLELCEGVSVMREDGRVYRRAPDFRALEYLVNRSMGRPAERMVHDIDGEIAGLLSELAASGEAETS